MVGRDPSTFYKRENVPIGEVIFEARNITGNKAKNVSFALRRGEILGIAGMAGSGRSELMNVLFGSAPLDYGEILINGKVVEARQPEARHPEQDVLHHGGPAEHRALSAADDRPERGRREPGEHEASSSSARRTTCGRETVSCKDLNIKTPSSRTRVDEPLRRQPAEGRAGQVVQHRRRDLHLRRADPGHRRRLEAGDLPDHGRPAEAGEGDHHGLLRHAGGDLHERPRARHEGRGGSWRSSPGPRSRKKTS